MNTNSKEKDIEEILYLYRQLFEVKCAPKKVNFEGGYFEEFKSRLENRSEKFLSQYKKELQQELKLLKIEKRIEREKEKFVNGIIEIHKKIELLRLKKEENFEEVNVETYKEDLMSVSIVELIKYKCYLLYWLANYKASLEKDNIVNAIKKRTLK